MTDPAVEAVARAKEKAHRIVQRHEHLADKLRKIGNYLVHGFKADGDAAALNSQLATLDEVARELESSRKEFQAALREQGWGPIPPGWVMVPREPTEAMTTAMESALDVWRRTGLTPDERMLRHVIKEGRPFTQATIPEKHAIRWRAALAAAPQPDALGRALLKEDGK